MSHHHSLADSSGSSSSAPLNDAEIDQLICQGAFTRNLESGYVCEYHVNSFAANDPIEDRYSLYDDVNSGNFFFGVYDGHGGHAAAEFARTQLIQYVQYNLFLKLQGQEQFAKSDREMANFVERLATTSDWDQFEQQIECNTGSKEAAEMVREMFDVTRAVPDALKRAFQQADQAFLLSGVLDKANKLHDVFSGACVLMTYVLDNYLFVANAGDCKALLGARVKNSNGEWQWMARPLSTIHTAKTEEATILKEHPNEPDAVAQGRVKGFLEPSRGLGDALFKDKYFNKCLLLEAQMPEPFTPPYTTANPDVQIYKLDPEESKDSFLILATDGLWDMISDQQAVETVVEAMNRNENASSALTKKALEQTGFEGSNLTEKMNCSLKVSDQSVVIL
eukprot:TRINITY_DN11502_c0_g1_i1.p1 TRINITY_DN11502_c0_g1~~TRINITY_DN11502_c0_g1_i1.p1  ORF type:complete len:393 (+),score=89.29 TRINITY_DN11502_c0_g1_i1:254-1432(+)